MENSPQNRSASTTIAAASTPSSSSDAAGVGEEQKQNLAQVTASIQKTLGLLHQLYLTISSFNSASQLPLLHRMNALVAELDNMQRQSESCSLQIPMEVLNLIDDGKNPDEFTKDVLNGCIAKNQITKGKTDSFKSLRKYLLDELEQTFPDEVENYREIRASSAAILFSHVTMSSYFNHMFLSFHRTCKFKLVEQVTSFNRGKTTCSSTEYFT